MQICAWQYVYIPLFNIIRMLGVWLERILLFNIGIFTLKNSVEYLNCPNYYNEGLKVESKSIKIYNVP